MIFFRQTAELIPVFSVTSEYHLFDIPFLAKSIFLYHQILINVFDGSTLGKFQSACTNLNYFLFLTRSLCKTLGAICYES